MKILFFTTNFYPYAGGLENYVLNLSTGLIKRGIQADVLTFNYGRLPSYENYQGINIYRIPSKSVLGKTYSIPRWNKQTKRMLKELGDQKYDYINTQTRFFLSTLLGWWFAKKNKIKLIHTEHGNVFVKHDNKLIQLIAWIYDQSLGRLIFKSAWKVIGISKPCCDFAIKMGANPKKVVYIPNSIDVTKYKKVKTDLRQKLGIPKENKIITFVGRLIYAKGVQDLILACKGISGVTLLIVGDGPYRKELENLAKEQRVNALFVGNKDQKGVIESLSITDIFVNPSYSEGMPTSVLEAAAMGLPIIATNVGGTKEIVGEGNTINLITPNQPEVIKIRIKQFIKDNYLFRKSSKIIKERIKNRFSWKRTLEFYKRLS
ncbi:hypothetical protein COY27_01595 [Candidatus Woesearchaeota archaeon CG_4_10_14_0_2_um_filter_33_13]|nr:MAG: hypothetical protein COY27_01595 [Candidatus Woesearchaeota archaeon CG_4_10_14_0_2_um_filter_33_13]